MEIRNSFELTLGTSQALFNAVILYVNYHNTISKVLGKIHVLFAVGSDCVLAPYTVHTVFITPGKSEILFLHMWI